MAPSCLATDSEPHLASLLMLKPLAIVVFLLWLFYNTITTIHVVFFSSLSSIPGPKTWIAFPLLRWFSYLRGRLDFDIRRFHNKYGEAVRYAPNEVSFITTEAWQDIYGFKKMGQSQLPKPATRFEKNRPVSIINADDAFHGRLRRALAHGFSDKALREQEPLLQHYIQLLVDRLKDVAEGQTPADMVKWYNFTTFDIIGDLAFGSPFNCLVSREYHYWVATNLNVIKSASLIGMGHYYPILTRIISWLMPPEIRSARDDIWSYATNTLNQRLSDEKMKGRPDFVDAMTRDNTITFDQLLGNSQTLIFAGSETTATLLSGVTYYLLKNPTILHKVTTEIRTTFPSESSINLNNVYSHAKVPYLNACLEEGLRLYPPVPSAFNRITVDTSTIISNYPIPRGTHVGVHQTAGNWSALNFARPLEYIPERWLPASPESKARETKSGALERKADTEASAEKRPVEFDNDNRGVVQPFSLGPRNCIGKNLANSEMRLILARVLWNFDLELCPESEDWVVDQKSTILWQKPPLMCRLRVREGVNAARN